MPYGLITDFESGVIPAVKSFFSLSQHMGLWFHYCQCVYQKIQELGFTSSHRTNESFKKVLTDILLYNFYRWINLLVLSHCMFLRPLKSTFLEVVQI